LSRVGNVGIAFHLTEALHGNRASIVFERAGRVVRAFR
jgi:hypothetical protein